MHDWAGSFLHRLQRTLIGLTYPPSAPLSSSETVFSFLFLQGQGQHNCYIECHMSWYSVINASLNHGAYCCSIVMCIFSVCLCCQCVCVLCAWSWLCLLVSLTEILFPLRPISCTCVLGLIMYCSFSCILS